MIDLIKILLPCLEEWEPSAPSCEEIRSHSLRIEFSDLVEVNRNFHYCQSGEYKQAALSIYNTDAQGAVRGRLELDAIPVVVVYGGSVRQPKRSTWVRTSRADGDCVAKLDHKNCTSEHKLKLRMHRSFRSPESLFHSRVNN
jgi:hypothetical protein